MKHPVPSGRGSLHYITAIAGDPQQNVEFYTGILLPDALGEQPELPPWLKPQRGVLTARLPGLHGPRPGRREDACDA
jgi:catechol 2,3-dioxygenase-like lactoylglutathione lyase family enzyme